MKDFMLCIFWHHKNKLAESSNVNELPAMTKWHLTQKYKVGSTSESQLM